MFRYISLICLMVLLTACQKQYQVSENENNTTLRFMVAAKDASKSVPKRVLVMELYTIDQCQKGQSLTRKHPDYQGVLLQHEQMNGDAIVEEILVATDQPITLTGSLSHIFGDEQSEICYTQFHQFKPSPKGIFEIQIDEFCEVRIFDLSTNAPESQSDQPIANNPDMIKCI